MINESKIKEVFFNLLETYSECNNLILSLSFSNEENKAIAGGSIFMPKVFGYINKTLMPIFNKYILKKN